MLVFDHHMYVYINFLDSMNEIKIYIYQKIKLFYVSEVVAGTKQFYFSKKY